VPQIANFPQKYLDEHEAWHESQRDRIPTRDRPGAPGYGDDFLSFHQRFITRVAADLIADRGLDPGLFAPWPDIPAELKADTAWPRVNADYDRIVSRPYTFETTDTFGLFLDAADGLHRWVHRNAAAALKDDSFADFHRSPESTLFYRWHGLITRWTEAVRQELTWPRRIDWEQLRDPGTRLPDGDLIVATVAENALPQAPAAEAAVDVWLHSELWYWKELNVPDGEGSDWNIHTGAGTFGGRRFDDSVALWAHQVHNGQVLTFKKAKTLGLLSNTYILGQLDRLPPLSRVTFDWREDHA
jgi:hypothetical protein